MGVGWIVAAATLELVDVGRDTPSIPWSMTVSVGIGRDMSSTTAEPCIARRRSTNHSVHSGAERAL